MNENQFNKVAWFEIGSSNTEETQQFFNNVLGWDYKTNNNLNGINYGRLQESSEHHMLLKDFSR
ncbi:hypothetical protein FGL72_09580 (plasmid) [Leuconostoc citreum]|uniref:hypothetical protein n=1 Tax=Leuconostoc citreum TaxID=33964 RepID=UPI0011BB37C4|nr:hypothetical protein [Leuconostoc citreum]QEA46697.1 hypothetical protein FGL82_09475 [Leuconostoc citreum]QEA64073.1 hypothetical protein FGL72_09580 [Leuconostoc citreum]